MFRRIDGIGCPAGNQHVRPVRDPSASTIDGGPDLALRSPLLPTLWPLLFHVGEPGAINALETIDSIDESIRFCGVNIAASVGPPVGRPTHCQRVWSISSL